MSFIMFYFLVRGLYSPESTELINICNYVVKLDRTSGICSNDRATVIKTVQTTSLFSSHDAEQTRLTDGLNNTLEMHFKIALSSHISAMIKCPVCSGRKEGI